MPETPNADTAARRGRSSAGHGVGSVSSRTSPVVQSTLDDGASTCRVFGSTPCFSAMIILITPATPAAACVCPTLDFSDPSQSGVSRFRP
ncbi:hypothetical protein OHS58_12820 [Amycolatopsis sp. NBC_00348]